MVIPPPLWDTWSLLTWKCASRHNGAHFFDIWTSKSGPNPSVFSLLTWQRASRQNGVHFFDIVTSKSGLRPWAFDTFDLATCFAPERRALFRHRNFQKWSETVSFWHFWLGNVLRARTACTFSTSQLPKVVWDRELLTLLTWKCASRHNGVHFFDISTSKSGPNVRWFTFFTCKCASRHNGTHFFDISTSKSSPKLRCFVHFDLEMCFAPQQRAISHLSSGQLAPHPPLWRGYFSTLRSPKSLEKTQWIMTFLPFRAPASSCFSLFLFSDLLTSWLLLPDSSHLCFYFPSVHIVRSLTSKLPSII